MSRIGNVVVVKGIAYKRHSPKVWKYADIKVQILAEHFFCIGKLQRVFL